MGPRALKVPSMCLWSCWKRFSLQNFTRLIQPFLPVWGISSKRRTRPSTPLFLTAFTDPLPPSTSPSTTVPAAVTQKPFWGATPKNLEPQVPCAPTLTVETFLMVLTRSCRSASSTHVTHDAVGRIISPLCLQPHAEPWMSVIAPMN